MNPTARVLWLQHQLYAEVHKPAVRRQIRRLFWATFASLASVMAATGGQVHWSTFWGLLPPALYVAAEEAWPTLPWAMIRQYIDAAKLPNVGGPRLSDSLPPAPIPTTQDQETNT